MMIVNVIVTMVNSLAKVQRWLPVVWQPNYMQGIALDKKPVGSTCCSYFDESLERLKGFRAHTRRASRGFGVRLWAC